MKITWIGHSCFCITSEKGLKIVTDPYAPGYHNIISYSPVNESADIVTLSHEHGDHNDISAVSGNPTVVKAPGVTSAKGIEFRGLAVYHDMVKGAERGPNTIFTFEMDGIRLSHLGDLGHPLSPEQLAELEGTEVLLAPTGGPRAALELQEVIDLWEKLRPSIVIPMHFKTAKCAFPKYDIDDLIRLRGAARRVGASHVSLSKDRLPSPIQILILDHSR